MAMSDKITLESTARGKYQTDVHGLDLMMERYLPASVEQLRRHVEEAAGELGYAADLDTVTECLMILAEFHGYATN